METKSVVLAGVGGQGVVSTSMVLAAAALEEGFDVKQSEVHGMAQRGGSVTSHVRYGSEPVFSAMVSKQGADVVLGFELLETLRNLVYVKPGGMVISSVEEMRNEVQIPDYPPSGQLLREVQAFDHILIDSARLAGKAGNVRTQSAVMLGAASPYLGIDNSVYEGLVRATFSRKGERVIEANLAAIRLGEAAGRCYIGLREAGVNDRLLYVLARKMAFDVEPDGAFALWAKVAESPAAGEVAEAISAYEGEVSSGSECARGVLELCEAGRFDGPRLKAVLDLSLGGRA